MVWEWSLSRGSDKSCKAEWGIFPGTRSSAFARQTKLCAQHSTMKKEKKQEQSSNWSVTLQTWNFSSITWLKRSSEIAQLTFQVYHLGWNIDRNYLIFSSFLADQLFNFSCLIFQLISLLIDQLFSWSAFQLIEFAADLLFKWLDFQLLSLRFSLEFPVKLLP